MNQFECAPLDKGCVRAALVFNKFFFYNLKTFRLIVCKLKSGLIPLDLCVAMIKIQEEIEMRHVINYDRPSSNDS